MSKNPKKVLKPADYEQQIGELTETLQRLQADFENYKKRATAEQAGLLENAKIVILTQLLPALDNFDRAAAHLPKELVDNSWAQGMSYVGTQLEQILDGMGVTKFAARANEQFDVNRFEAIEHVTSKLPADIIVETVTPGYEINGQVVRPAAVRVSAGTPRNNQTMNQSNKLTSKKGELNE